MVLMAAVDVGLGRALAAAECGNSIVEAGESCDDGNHTPGDCCSPDCVDEEIRGVCQTCDDGLDNDEDGRLDAEDSGCATFSEYQRSALVVATAARSPADDPAVRSVLLPGALVGDAVDASCSTGVCICPQSAPGCQTAGSPCQSDGDCVAVPYPLGRSRAGICAADAKSDPSIECRPPNDLVVKARAIARMPGVRMDPIRVAAKSASVVLLFAGGKQVIDVDSVELGSQVRLELAGEADTVLVLRVDRSFVLGAGAAIALAAELEPERVLWVFAGEEGRIALGDASRIAGTILAPERGGIELGSGVRIDGAILASQVTERCETGAGCRSD
jgi:cysteine-rich repeat protein